MTDKQIEQYLNNNHWSVDPQDCIMNVFNTSPQIIYKNYNKNTGMMTIITPDNTYLFEWKLRKR